MGAMSDHSGLARARHRIQVLAARASALPTGPWVAFERPDGALEVRVDDGDADRTVSAPLDLDTAMSVALAGEYFTDVLAGWAISLDTAAQLAELATRHGADPSTVNALLERLHPDDSDTASKLEQRLQDLGGEPVPDDDQAGEGRPETENP